MASDSNEPTSGGSCGATCGISRERERQKAAARAVAQRAYPGMSWVPVPAWTPEDPPVGFAEVTALADALAEVLPTRPLVVPASGDETDAIYLLCGLHAPCWLEVRAGEGTGALPEPARETYLRVAFSPLGRYVTLQEVRVVAAVEADGAWVEERSVAGVEDRRLQLFVKATQGLLRKRKLVALDAAFLAEQVPDPDGGVHARLGGPPTLGTLLFEAQPPGTLRGEWAPRAGG